MGQGAGPKARLVRVPTSVTADPVGGRPWCRPTGPDCVFGHAEVARLFLWIGEGMSLRAASQELRDSVFRSHGRDTQRTWKDHGESSLPRLVREADRRWRRHAADDHAARVKERLAERYAAEADLRTRLDLPTPPSRRPRRPRPIGPATRSRAGALSDVPELVAEWVSDVEWREQLTALIGGSDLSTTCVASTGSCGPRLQRAYAAKGLSRVSWRIAAASRPASVSFGRKRSTR